jgi:murein DD-endopeptidase MepM/ murein hydrolase activator NlpD
MEALAGELSVYSYTAQSGDTLLTIAARCGIHYAAIATLNRLSSTEIPPGRELLLPTIEGLFIAEKPESDIELLLASGVQGSSREGFPVLQTEATPFIFYPGLDFTPTERAFFLNPGYHFPLKKFVMTSHFGTRVSPISGRVSRHAGVDLAAETGASVYATRSGTVRTVSESPVYGIYIVIAHDSNPSGWSSLYGHLSKTLVKQGQTVSAGQLIGQVGSTGLSTGPHLHFELRHGGVAQDPERYW